jgi:hypothetical protein
MVVKRKSKKNIKKSRTTKKRKNPDPSLFGIRKHMEIRSISLNDGSNRRLVTVYFMGEPVIHKVTTETVEKLMKSSHGKDIIAKDIKTVLDQRVRKNPETNKEEKKEDKKKHVDSTWTSPVGLPTQPLEAWKLGYHAGLEEGINLCNITDYFKRREVRQMLQNINDQHFRDLTTQLKAAGNIIGARVPRVRAGVS